MVIDESTRQYIRSSVEVSDGGCWVKPRRRSGYAWFRLRGVAVRAHRLAWMAFHGEIPVGMYVCHRCNNKACLNPSHLYLGTHRQNIADAGRDGLLSHPHQPQGPTRENAQKTACVHGHPFNAANTYVRPTGERECRACRRRDDLVYKRRVRALTALGTERA